MDIVNVLKLQVRILNNPRIKEVRLEDIAIKKDIDSYEFVYLKEQINLFSDIQNKLCYPNYSDAFENIMKETNFSIDTIDAIFVLTRKIIIALFLYQTENQYYENNFMKIFFLSNCVNNDTYSNYNLSQFIRYSYTDSYIWGSLNYVGNSLYLKTQEDGNIELMPVIKSIFTKILENKELRKSILSLFEELILINPQKNKKIKTFKDIAEDELSDYIFLNPLDLAKSPEKYCDILLSCIKTNQSEQNTFVSKFILNNYLHYFLKDNIDFLENNENYLVEKSDDKKILNKIYYVLYNLNQIKLDVWKEINLDYFKINQHEYFYKYNIIYGYNKDKFIRNNYVGKI